MRSRPLFSQLQRLLLHYFFLPPSLSLPAAIVYICMQHESACLYGDVCMHACAHTHTLLKPRCLSSCSAEKLRKVNAELPLEFSHQLNTTFLYPIRARGGKTGRVCDHPCKATAALQWRKLRPGTIAKVFLQRTGSFVSWQAKFPSSDAQSTLPILCYDR